MKCSKCGKEILPEIFEYNKEGKPIMREIYVKGFGDDVFCGFCATTCFFINGEMISMSD